MQNISSSVLSSTLSFLLEDENLFKFSALLNSVSIVAGVLQAAPENLSKLALEPCCENVGRVEVEVEYQSGISGVQGWLT